MSRQSISLTAPNTEWLRKKVEIEGEYRSNSEVVNDLIRKEREQESRLEYLRSALKEGEKSGISERSEEQIIQAVIERKRSA